MAISPRPENGKERVERGFGTLRKRKRESLIGMRSPSFPLECNVLGEASNQPPVRSVVGRCNFFVPRKFGFAFLSPPLSRNKRFLSWTQTDGHTTDKKGRGNKRLTLTASASPFFCYCCQSCVVVRFSIPILSPGAATLFVSHHHGVSVAKRRALLKSRFSPAALVVPLIGG